MKSIVFIAVQCSQCSTMQVKQKKKSSNKWNCAVCNQKQSVRKVFAQGFMAKDIRTFVQSFNMSRKLIDEQSQFAETLATSPEEKNVVDEDECSFSVNQRKKRSDWTEYLDRNHHRIENQRELQQNGEDSETKVVTELDQSMFKKPRLANYSTRLVNGGSEELRKPRFTKRNANKKIISQEEPVKNQVTSPDNYITPAYQRPQRCQPSVTRTNSKWNDYITEEDDIFQHQCNSNRAFKDHTDPCVLEAMTNEQRVEDDIHPDFM